jgi:hypothetical protein
MSSITNLTRVAIVGRGFSEECVWRMGLGEKAPLHVAVTEGPLDAPMWMPAGSSVWGGAARAKTKFVQRPDVQE